MSDADNNRRENNMRTVRTKVYKFNELSEEAKQTAIENYRNDGIYTDYIYDEAHETVKAFHEVFGTKENRRGWLECDCSNIDDNILNLKGLRLRTYIINNFSNYLYKGKYYSIGKYTYVNPNNVNDYKYEYKSRYSKVIFDNSCTLTGVCYDDSLLAPIYEFLDWKLRPDYNTYMDFETLMNDCFASLEKDLDAEVEYKNSDEAIKEDLLQNDNEYTRTGTRFI